MCAHDIKLELNRNLHASVPVHWERFQENWQSWTQYGVTAVFIFSRQKPWHLLQLHMARYRTAGGGWGALHQTETGVRVQPWRCLHKKALCNLHFKQCIGFYLAHLTFLFVCFLLYCPKHCVCMCLCSSRYHKAMAERESEIDDDEDHLPSLVSFTSLNHLPSLVSFTSLFSLSPLFFSCVGSTHLCLCWRQKHCHSEWWQPCVVIIQNYVDHWGSFWVIETIIRLSLSRMMLTTEGHSEWKKP